MNYQPNPIDTRHIEFSNEIDELVEMLARNTHEVWSQTRLNQGWDFGSERDDAKKQHPCITSYDDLPESERDVDRNTAIQVLKTIMALGYTIHKIERSDADGQTHA